MTVKRNGEWTMNCSYGEYKNMSLNNKIKIWTVLVCILLGIAYLSSSKMAVQAASILTGTSGVTEGGFMVHWTKDSRAVEYYLAADEDRDTAVSKARAHSIVVPASDNSYTFSGLKKGTKYYVALAYSYTDSGTAKTSDPVTLICKTAIGKITGLTQTRWYVNTKKVYVTWDAQTAASYEYVFMDQRGKTISTGKCLTNTFTYRISNKKCYSFKVKAYATINGRKHDSGYSNTIYLLAQPMIKSLKFGSAFDISISDGKLTVSWDKVKAATNYNIYVSKKRDSGYEKVGSVSRSKTKAVIRKFRKKKFNKKGTYYIYIEAVKKKSGASSSSGVNYVWKYANGKVSETYFHGKFK